MKIKFHSFGAYDKKIKIDQSKSQSISSFIDGILEVEGKETLEIKDRLLRKAHIDLKAYQTDLEIYLFSVSSISVGRVVAIVVPWGSQLDIYNENDTI